MNKKQKVITYLFERCKEKNDFKFHNDDVKEACKKFGFGNPFDATKFDNSSLLPKILGEEDYFIVHLGEGWHEFVKGIKYGYHSFEKIDNVKHWKYKKSILNELDTSESNILSVVSNQRILHDFLYEDIIASPRVYGARRTKKSFTYKVGKKEIKTNRLQMEIDLTMEHEGAVTIFEGKNGFPKDFAVYQLFNPFVYYSDLQKMNKLPINQITCCYVLRKKQEKEKGPTIRFYNYAFKNPRDISSITLLKSAEYKLSRR